MVKKREKHAAPVEEQPAAQSGWGSMNHAASSEPAPGISANPEDRQPPLDEGWDEAEARQRSEASEEEERPVMGLAPANSGVEVPDPAPAEEPKPKKGKGGKKAKAEEKTAPSASGNVTTSHNKDPLVSFIERLERLAEEQTAIKDDMKEVFAEAKGNGYDVSIIRVMLRRRRIGADAVREMEALIDTYEKVIGYD